MAIFKKKLPAEQLGWALIEQSLEFAGITLNTAMVILGADADSRSKIHRSMNAFHGLWAASTCEIGETRTTGEAAKICAIGKSLVPKQWSADSLKQAKIVAMQMRGDEDEWRHATEEILRLSIPDIQWGFGSGLVVLGPV